MWTDLGVLTPSLVVGGAFIAAVFVMLRHEMAPRRRGRASGEASGDMAEDGVISAGDDDSAQATSRRDTP